MKANDAKRRWFKRNNVDRNSDFLGRADQTSSRPISTAVFYVLLCACFLFFVMKPYTAIKSLLACMAWVSAGYACIRLAALLTAKPKRHLVAEMSDDLPIYTVLVPLFHEAQMIDQLMSGLSRLKYPTDKIEIILITEKVDPITTQAVMKRLRPPFRQIIVPKGTPQTKPRALNYALKQSEGQFIELPVIWTNKRHLLWGQRPYLLSTPLTQI